MKKNGISLSYSPTIIVTDSGLGGISVLANLEKFIKNKNSFDSVRLIFFNAHAEKGFGYNSMKNTKTKVDVFNSALQSMVDRFDPELILVACNTLSVITHLTETSRERMVPLLGIVDFGVDLIYNNMCQDDDSIVILYGTPTTIESDVYKQKLIKLGIEGSRIINQPCYLLETEIQKNARSIRTKEMIDDFTLEAVTKSEYKNNINKKCFGALCCTHYGFSSDFFLESLSKHFRSPSTLNPNKLMSDFVLSINSPITGKAEISVEVYSRVEIPVEEIDSIGSIIKTKAPKTFKALKEYNLDTGLFEFNRSGKN